MLQVSHALHSSPLTVKAATAAGLITGAKYHSEATKRILHNTARQGDPAMLLAAKPSAVLNEVTANLPVEGKLAPVSKGSVQTESEPKSEVSSVVSVQAGDDAADTEGSSHSSALKMLARVEECMLHDRGSKATLITDSPQGVRVNAASRVPLSKYIRVSFHIRAG